MKSVRSFTNTTSGSNKFWSIQTKSNTLHIRYGKIGSVGRTVVKTYASKPLALTAANKLIREKCAKGYKETESILVPSKQSVSAFTPMNKVMFWKLIDSSLAFPSLKKQSHFIKKELMLLNRKDLVAFEHIYNRLDNHCYSWNLWAAAYTIHRGCSDDSFTDFRGWLITRGKVVFEKAVKSSDSLSVLGKKKLMQSKQGDFFLFLAGIVYEDLYKSSIEQDKHVKLIKIKTKPSGKEWKEGDAQALKKINPQLFRLVIGKK